MESVSVPFQYYIFGRPYQLFTRETCVHEAGSYIVDRDLVMMGDDGGESSASSVLVSSDDDTGVTDGAEPGFFSIGDAEAEIEYLSDDNDSNKNNSSSDEVGDDGEQVEESDSSSDEEANPLGDIPMRWYEGYDHVGYDKSGAQILRKERPSALDRAIDPHAWRKFYDEKTGEEIVLTREELKEIAYIRAKKLPDGGDGAEDEFIAWSGAPEKFPIRNAPEPKRRFLPSRHEAQKVVKLVRAMRAGLIPKRRHRRKNAEDDVSNTGYNYDVWEGHEEKPMEEMSRTERTRSMLRIPPPKIPLPDNHESYNPPEEYLPSEKEKAQWEKMDEETKARKLLPTKYDALRHVPLYKNYLKERFERCLDLYLAVRVRKERRKINPNDLIPNLPSPKELRPFPTGKILTIGPLSSRARTISVHPNGQWLLSGSDDGKVRLFEVATGYLRHTFNLDAYVPKIDDRAVPVMNVSWCPRHSVYVFSAILRKTLFILSAAEAIGVPSYESDRALHTQSKVEGEQANAKLPSGIQWKEMDQNGNEILQTEVDETTISRIEISHPRPLRQAAWHHKGDYIATVGRDGSGVTVAIHRLSKRATQIPFRKRATGVQIVQFHPSRPFIFVATMHHVRVYNLAQQTAVKTLKPGVKYISSMAVHPSGDHVLVSSYDKRTCWFDMDLSTKPYKSVGNHRKAVRAVAFHPRLPLWADAADDGSSHIFHGMVYDDLTRNALIVPLKKIEGTHSVTQDLGILDIKWHPRLPWLFSSGADRMIHLLGDMT
eukprot:Plantae.Rhodophyta-Hildenbrandia_rubra.ctg14992.p1 GENE.Plantae.Rhodophyta-Hildenbrandia_rubra.ctg14992~~Plantae.Rhodophyta-Hildenbrandia_rubra.ctg14992.p1  ORF type:complete len:769 (-),score=123.24 Plantae.Rhodophyta-Hildenbrandia_rubra.ctg14992:101-2407(-)